MGNIKAAFFDVDGTLYSHKTASVPESAKKAVKLLQENGVKVVIATGRHIVALDQLGLGEGYDFYIVLNGQLVLDKDRNVVFGNEVDDSEKLKEMFLNQTYPVQIMQENDSYLNKVDSVVEGAMKDFASPIAPVHELIDEPIYQACIFVPYEETESIREQLPNSIVRQCETTCLDIIAKTGGKVKGIERFLEIEGILPEETIAFGDANNDIEMLNFCGISVAMGNGYEEVKEISDFVTTDIDEDGIWNAVKHFEDRFISEELEMEN